MGQTFYATAWKVWPSWMFRPPLVVPVQRTWDQQILPYVGNSKDVFACPTDFRGVADKRSYAQNSAVQATFASQSTASNTVWLGPENIGNFKAVDIFYPPWWNIVEVVPERTLLMGERYYDNGNAGLIGGTDYAAFYNGESSIVTTHKGKGTCIGFADAHADWIPESRISPVTPRPWTIAIKDVIVGIISY